MLHFFFWFLNHQWTIIKLYYHMCFQQGQGQIHIKLRSFKKLIHQQQKRIQTYYHELQRFHHDIQIYVGNVFNYISFLLSFHILSKYYQLHIRMDIFLHINQHVHNSYMDSQHYKQDIRHHILDDHLYMWYMKLYHFNHKLYSY